MTTLEHALAAGEHSIQSILLQCDPATILGRLMHALRANVLKQMYLKKEPSR